MSISQESVQCVKSYSTEDVRSMGDAYNGAKTGAGGEREEDQRGKGRGEGVRAGGEREEGLERRQE